MKFDFNNFYFFDDFIFWNKVIDSNGFIIDIKNIFILIYIYHFNNLLI